MSEVFGRQRKFSDSAGSSELAGEDHGGNGGTVNQRVDTTLPPLDEGGRKGGITP